jgi:hypothetical protein
VSKYVSPELYDKYKYKILEMSPAIQCYEGTRLVRDSSCLTDEEIAERLGLDVEDVAEIRCIAEIELLPSDTWFKSERFKREKTRKSAGKANPASKVKSKK